MVRNAEGGSGESRRIPLLLVIASWQWDGEQLNEAANGIRKPRRTGISGELENLPSGY